METTDNAERQGAVEQRRETKRCWTVPRNKEAMHAAEGNHEHQADVNLEVDLPMFMPIDDEHVDLLMIQRDLEGIPQYVHVL